MTNDYKPTFVGLEDIERVEPPSGASDSGRYCRVCGTGIHWVPGRGRPPTLCPEHRTSSSAKNTGKSSGKAKGGKGATEAEWDRFCTVVLISVTYCIGRFAAGAVGPFLRCPPGVTPAELEEATDYLSMDGNEAKPIAKLLASRITPSALNKKAGRYIVQALDYEDVGYALWGYGKRIAPALANRMNAPKVVNAPSRPSRKAASTNGTTGQVSTGPSASDPTQSAEYLNRLIASQRRHP